jgi:hypothetical protein
MDLGEHLGQGGPTAGRLAGRPELPWGIHRACHCSYPADKVCREENVDKSVEVDVALDQTSQGLCCGGDLGYGCLTSPKLWLASGARVSVTDQTPQAMAGSLGFKMLRQSPPSDVEGVIWHLNRTQPVKELAVFSYFSAQRQKEGRRIGSRCAR